MHLHEGPGDILVFLTGSEECEQATKVILNWIKYFIIKIYTNI
jgi:HrpA-like RNA helicase